MSQPWSLGRPHPEHVPTVTSVPSRYPGAHWGARNTALACSCGVAERVALVAPSQGGRAVARAAYALHLLDALAEREAEPVFGEPPCL